MIPVNTGANACTAARASKYSFATRVGAWHHAQSAGDPSGLDGITFPFDKVRARAGPAPDGTVHTATMTSCWRS
jgi:hypothetical protein